MFGWSILFFILSFIALIVGLIKPSLFNRLFKGNATRKKTLWTFLGAMLIFAFVMLATDGGTPSPSATNKAAQQNSVQPGYFGGIKTDVTDPKDAFDQQLISKIVQGVTSLSSVANGSKDFREINLDSFTPNSPLAKKYGTDSRYVTITMNTSNGILLISPQNEDTYEAGDILKTIFPLSSNIESVDIAFFGPVKDELGNSKDTQWVTVDMDRNLYQQINWSGFDYSKLPDVLQAANAMATSSADVDANFYDINPAAQN